MALEWLFEWWNAVYTVPLAFVLVFLAITSVVGLVGGAVGELGHAHGDHDVNAEIGHDHDVGADALHHGLDVSADAGADAGDMDMDLDMDGDIDAIDRAIAVERGHAPDAGILVGAMVLIGAGRAPLLMLLQILLLLWGLIGIGLHQIGGSGPGALLWSVPATLVLSVAGTRLFAGIFGKVYRPFETAAIRRSQIVGRTGKVIYPVNGDAGTVHVRDQHGTLHRLRARTSAGRLESGREIIITAYDAGEKVYQVDDASNFVDRM